MFLTNNNETHILSKEVANYMFHGNWQLRPGLGLKGVYRRQVNQR